MRPLTLADIRDGREYERERDAFRREVIALKRTRRLEIGPIVSVVLENRTTVRFQVEEMARAERMSTDEQVQEELDVYNPLLPGPGELSMTLFVELTSEAELREWLPKLVGIERSVVVRIGAGDDVHEVPCTVDPAHASQLTREEVTASVHYVRVSLTPADATRFATERVELAIDHPDYRHGVELPPAAKASVLADWSDADAPGAGA
ncbi:MAG TPA: DUF3501 family protein [Acidimicrobiales bacterium]|nr:DUF3501 family protein [Acidimicrobiales bacterium]